jgi:hypothetical protein
VLGVVLPLNWGAPRVSTVAASLYRIKDAFDVCVHVIVKAPWLHNYESTLEICNWNLLFDSFEDFLAFWTVVRRLWHVLIIWIRGRMCYTWFRLELCIVGLGIDDYLCSNLKHAMLIFLLVKLQFVAAFDYFFPVLLLNILRAYLL